MSEMVERVARAIYDADQWRDNPMIMGYAVDLARAAIEAMREPNVAMLRGARDWSIVKNGQGVGNEQASGCYRAMIDAALKD